MSGCNRNRLLAREYAERQQPAPHIRRHEEVFFDVFAACIPNALRILRIRQQVANLLGATLYGVNQHSR
jgi:hypothetical protein